MGIDVTMRDALADRPDAIALACMDMRSGLVLGLQVRADVPRDDVEAAAFSAAQLCTAPSSEEGDEACDESFVASSHWVHAFARVPARRDLVVVGMAPGDANVALFEAWIRQVAAGVGPRA